MNSIKNAIQVVKSSITQNLILYAEVVPMILNVLRQAEHERDEEKRVSVRCRLEIEGSYLQEAIQIQQQQIEEWEELVRETQRRYETALRFLILKRDRMIV